MRRTSRVIRFATVLLLAVLAAPPGARGQQAGSPRCAAPEYRQFDFWLGEWEVRNPSGAVVGTNSITADLGGSVLREHWRGGGGSTGRSFNIYDRSTGSWHQTWVDNSGLLLRLDGGLVDGAMVLRGETVGRDGSPSLQRITWTPGDDGNVRQLWESSSDAGATWSTVFDGTYVKQSRD